MANQLNPTFQDVTPSTKGYPNMSSWYFTSAVSGVSEESLPWMLAQGWQLSAAVTNSGVDPPVTTYSMARTRLLHWNVLASLLTDFTNAYNEGRDANDKRYEDVITQWQDVLDKHQDDIQDFQDDKAQDADGYITLMLSDIDSLSSDYTAMETDFNSYDSGDRETALAELKTQWSTAASSAEAEYDTMVSGLSLGDIIADVDTAIDEFATAATAFNNTANDLRTELASDFATHQPLARSFLTDLGTTELARINERFDNSLAAAKQDLTNRGFYSSAIVTDITTRNTRERNEAIAELNDRLNREKLANEHTLYEQQYKMRLGGLEASLKAIDASARIVQSRLAHGGWAAEIRHKIASLSVDARSRLLGLREGYYKTLMESVQWEQSRRLELYDRLMQVRLRQFELRERTCDKDFELIKYQVDSRNDIAAALFGFVERRTDEYPDMGAIAQLTASLGETGASTWQSA